MFKQVQIETNKSKSACREIFGQANTILGNIDSVAAWDWAIGGKIHKRLKAEVEALTTGLFDFCRNFLSSSPSDLKALYSIDVLRVEIPKISQQLDHKLTELSSINTRISGMHKANQAIGK